MSSKTLEKKSEDLIEVESISEPVSLRKFIIPFSHFSKSESYIYFGFERIPFRERHPIYQKILKNEFKDATNQFKKILRH
jgi:hypothetical protein